ncbi:MAG: hypothetical protein Q8Q97_00825 [bacterium]|nr:hypothetical protein [bacterium]
MPVPQRKTAFSEAVGSVEARPPERIMPEETGIRNTDPELFGALLFFLFPLGLWLVRSTGRSAAQKWFGVCCLAASAGGLYFCFPPHMWRTDMGISFLILVGWNIFTTGLFILAWYTTRKGWGFRGLTLDNVAMDFVLVCSLVGSIAARAAMGLPTTPGWLGLAALLTVAADIFLAAGKNFKYTS